MAKKPKFQKFDIPIQFLENLYEMSGGQDKNKGYFLVFINEEGNGQLRYKFDCQATEFAIIKLIELYNNQYENGHELTHGEEFLGENEEDD